MSAAASGHLVKLGLAGLCVWGAIAAASIWSNSIASSEPIPLQVAKAEPGFDQRNNEPVISITLTEASRGAIAKITQENVGKPMALRIDGREVMKPIVREPILGASLQISGKFTVEETKDIANRLSSGGKVEVEILE